jgi:hypothetical protein
VLLDWGLGPILKSTVMTSVALSSVIFIVIFSTILMSRKKALEAPWIVIAAMTLLSLGLAFRNVMTGHLVNSLEFANFWILGFLLAVIFVVTGQSRLNRNESTKGINSQTGISQSTQKGRIRQRAIVGTVIALICIVLLVTGLLL